MKNTKRGFSPIIVLLLIIIILGVVAYFAHFWPFSDQSAAAVNSNISNGQRAEAVRGLPQTIAVKGTVVYSVNGPHTALTWSKNNATDPNPAHYEIRKVRLSGLTKAPSQSGLTDNQFATNMRALDEQGLLDRNFTSSQLKNIKGTVTSYNDGGILRAKTADIHYLYVVIALDKQNKPLARSNMLEVVVTAKNAPANPSASPTVSQASQPAPTPITAGAQPAANGPQPVASAANQSIAPNLSGAFSKSWLGQRRVGLTWTDPIARTNYIIFRTSIESGKTVTWDMMKDIAKNPAKAFVYIPGSIHNYVDKAVEEGQTYFYVVKATNNDGSSSDISMMVTADINK